MTYAAFLEEVGALEPATVVVDAGLATSMQTSRFAAAFPERYVNLGIAEQNAVGVASGLARRGFVPLVHSFGNFLARRAHDQVAVSVGWPGVNVKLVAGSVGLYDGRLGASHLATDDLATMTALPRVLVAEPATLGQTRALLLRAVRHDGPVYLRIRRHGWPARDRVELTDAGTVVVHEAHGARCTLIAGGSMLGETLDAAALLARDGIPADVIHVAVVQPLDAQPIIAAVERTGKVLVVENHGPVGGFGDAVARVLGPLGVRLIRLAIPVGQVPAGGPAFLLEHCGLDAVGIARSARALATPVISTHGDNGAAPVGLHA